MTGILLVLIITKSTCVCMHCLGLCNVQSTHGGTYTSVRALHALVHGFVRLDIICSSKYALYSKMYVYQGHLPLSSIQTFSFSDINLLFLLNSNFHRKAKINDIVLFTRHLFSEDTSIDTYRHRFDIIYIEEVQ